MRKTAAHFKPKSTEKPKRKKVVAVTLATALVLALVIALAVAGCNDSGEAGSESSAPAATPTAAPTEEPTPSPSPSPTPAPTPSAQPEEEPDFVWNVPTEKAGVTAGFYTDGEEYYFELSSDTANSATLLEWLSTGLFIGMEPMAERIDTIVFTSSAASSRSVP